jgi:hypothetical protein
MRCAMNGSGIACGCLRSICCINLVGYEYGDCFCRLQKWSNCVIGVVVVVVERRPADLCLSVSSPTDDRHHSSLASINAGHKHDASSCCRLVLGSWLFACCARDCLRSHQNMAFSECAQTRCPWKGWLHLIVFVAPHCPCAKTYRSCGGLGRSLCRGDGAATCTPSAGCRRVTKANPQKEQLASLAKSSSTFQQGGR